MIAGRCECGVAFSLFLKRDWDEHLKCYGLRWCGVCGEAAIYRGDCTPCRNRRGIEWRRNHPPTERCRGAQRLRNRKWHDKQRKQGTAYYVQQKARLRERYRSDPVYRASRQAAAREYRALIKRLRQRVAA